MLEKPDLDEQKIIACLEADFGLRVEELSFLPLGADRDTAVYRLAADDGRTYFLKLRRGDFSEAAVAVPGFLSEQGLQAITPPIAARNGRLWAGLDAFKAILYPYVDGRDGFEAKLSPEQWAAFGRALKAFHAANVPPEVTASVPREAFSSRWRQSVISHLARLEEEPFADPVAADMAAFLLETTDETLEVVMRAEGLARLLKAAPPDFILCHGDIHGWNLLIDPAGQLYLVDWDTLIFAPKERDLMFVGAGLGESGYTPEEEETLFYQGYGQVEINLLALAYYRYERIVEDIAVICDHVFLSTAGGRDREKALALLKSNYRPNGTIAAANRAYKRLRGE